MATWLVRPLPERPDFRLVVTFLWGDFHDIDSDGDATNPASTQWTWLYLQNRGNPAEIVNIDVAEEPTSFRIKADLPWLAAATAYFLAAEFDARVRAEEGREWLAPGTLIDRVAPFDLKAAVLRARDSVWRKATLDNPYPNRR